MIEPTPSMKNPTPENPPDEQLRSNIIEFPDGLPGFPASREFIMTQKPEERPFAWMQSVADPKLSFAVVDAYAWVKDFMFEVEDSALEAMGSLDPMDYAVYFILCIQKHNNGTTLQAKPNAPVLVNTRNRQARQLIVSLGSSLEKAEALCLQL
jgi:flagellar assembly factor FliW